MHVSAGIDTDYDWIVDPICAPQGRKVHLAAAIKEAVNIPVISVGVIREPEFAEDLLAKGKADFVAIGRGLLADPDWPIKASKGRSETIRKCFSCNHCAGTRAQGDLGIRCVVNLEVGQGDDAWKVKPAADKKRIAVVGGGPAGIEASRIAALRGHSVTLFEKGPRLGGQLRIAAKVPGKDKINWLIDTLAAGVTSSGADVRLCSQVTAETVTALAPDVLVLATGGQPMLPSIPGVGNENVTTAWALIDGTVPVGEGRYAVIGGSSTGCEAAILLSTTSDKVHVIVIEQLGELAPDMEQFARQATRRRVAESPNIETHTGWRVVEITPGRVRAVDARGVSRLFEVDAVVLATGVRPFVPMLADLVNTGTPAEVYTVGDCSQPGTIASALADGRVLGASI